MLSTFLRVREVSTLVPRLAAAGRRAGRRRTPRAASAPPRATLARAPGPPELADAHPTPHRRRLAPPPPAQARRHLPCPSAAAGATARRRHRLCATLASRRHRGSRRASQGPRRRPARRRPAPPPRPRPSAAASRAPGLAAPPLCFVSLASRAHGSGVMGGLFILLIYSAVDCKFHINSRKNAKIMK